MSARDVSITELFNELGAATLRAVEAEQKLLKIADMHKPFPDDGVEYCGWDGVDGCREVWPCHTIRILRGEL